jgi:hypothetical protein
MQPHEFVVECWVIDDVSVETPLAADRATLRTLQCTDNESWRRIEHSIAPALFCCRASLMDDTRIDYA